MDQDQYCDQASHLILFGSAFDPIHNGHLAAIRAVKKLDLGPIILLPSGQHPFSKTYLFSQQQRRRFIDLAISDFDQVFVSEYEWSKSTVSYTVDTVQLFKNTYPQAKLYFLLGTDQFSNLERWQSLDVLNDLLESFLLVQRGDDKVDVKGHSDLLNISVQQVPMSPVDASSTYIRAHLEEPDRIRSKVPKTVLKEIQNR